MISSLEIGHLYKCQKIWGNPRGLKKGDIVLYLGYENHLRRILFNNKIIELAFDELTFLFYFEFYT